MTDLTIRPTAKFIMAGALFAALVFLGLEIAWYTQWRENERLTFIPILAPLLLVWPAWSALKRQFIKMTISGDRLRYERGGISKTTRNIQLSKVQDVRVDQSMMQRIFRVGNLSLETSGETSLLVIEQVDNPQSIAEEISHRSQHHGTPTA